MENIKTQLTRHKAQTAMELAIFGGILIFVIGVIIKTSLSAGQLQNQNLIAMRLAMKMSYLHSEGHTGGGGRDGNASRNNASVLFLEDRLTADTAKYGTVDRVPLMAQGSGTHTRNLLLPLDRNETHSIPVTDMYINGRHFPFTVAGFKNICLTEFSDQCASACGSDRCTSWCGISPIPTSHERCDDYDPNCRDAGGCMRLYHLIANHPEVKKDGLWCDDINYNCPQGADDVGYRVDERFDLDRDGDHDDKWAPAGGDGGFVPDVEREGFAWQWYPVMACREEKLNSDKEPKKDCHLKELSDGSERQGIIKHDNDSKNIMLDFDRDLKEEQLIAMTRGSGGEILAVQVLDYQEGDIDTTQNSYDLNINNAPPSGITLNTQLFSFVSTRREATPTYLLLEEGKLFETTGDQKQYVRHVQKKDHIDIIQREIQLSNNTGRFCTGTGTPPAQIGGQSWEYANPVEICVDSGPAGSKGCFWDDGVNSYTDLTCMDLKDNMIYVRSRVKDLHGRKWITDVSEDDYIEFDVPENP